MFIIKKNPPQTNVSRNIRFTEELFDELNKIAVNSNISFNSLVLQCCQYALQNLQFISNTEESDESK